MQTTAVAKASGPLRIAMMGTRGVPARYGGFETAIEEVGSRLVMRGHEITVYCRSEEQDSNSKLEHLGMHRVVLPAMRQKVLETPSHTLLSLLRSFGRRRPDMVFLFNAANAAFVPLLRMREIPVAVHVDGLEWRRTKWSGLGQRFYRASESMAVRWSDALIADASGIADYYREVFGASSELIAYGAPILTDLGHDRIDIFRVSPKNYNLIVARFEPENHVLGLIRGYISSNTSLPLLVVGSAPYSDEYTSKIELLAERDDRIHLLGPIWDQHQLDQLYAHALVYLHGHSVGGTNPSLLRAIGAGAAVAAWDVEFNREVLGENAWFVDDEVGISRTLVQAESEITDTVEMGLELKRRARILYRWDEVAESYEDLAIRLAAGWSRSGEVSGRRRSSASYS